MRNFLQELQTPTPWNWGVDLIILKRLVLLRLPFPVITTSSVFWPRLSSLDIRAGCSAIPRSREGAGGAGRPAARCHTPGIPELPSERTVVSPPRALSPRRKAAPCWLAVESLAYPRPAKCTCSHRLSCVWSLHGAVSRSHSAKQLSGSSPFPYWKPSRSWGQGGGGEDEGDWNEQARVAS